MASLPNGSTLAVASVFATTKTISGISNAVEAVVTSTGHGVVAGDYIELTTGWAKADGRAFRVKSSADANTFVIEGFDTTDTTLYPAGSGAGSFRKVTTWAQISKIMNTSSGGGEPRNVTYRYLESDSEQSINDGFSATTQTLDIDADATTTPGYLALKSLTDSQAKTIVRLTLRSGSVVLTPGTVALNETPQITQGQVMVVRASVNGSARPTRY